MAMRALNCPECTRVVSSQGLPNHRLFVHGVVKAPRVQGDPVSGARGNGIPWGTIALLVGGAVVIFLIVTYTLWRCPQCAKLSVVRRDDVIAACPKCGAPVS